MITSKTSYRLRLKCPSGTFKWFVFVFTNYNIMEQRTCNNALIIIKRFYFEIQFAKMPSVISTTVAQLQIKDMGKWIVNFEDDDIGD